MDKPSAPTPTNDAFAKAEEVRKADAALFGMLKGEIAPTSDEEQQEEVKPQTEETEEPNPEEGEKTPDEAQGETADAEQAEETEETNDRTEEVNGEQVPLKELKAGYMKDADYRKKTAHVAEQRKQFEAALGELGGKLQQATEVWNLALAVKQKELDSMAEPPESLLDEDPAEYMKREKALNRKRLEVQAIQAKLAETTQIHQQMQEQNFKRYVGEQQALLAEKVPVLKAKEKREELGKFVIETYGFTHEQLKYAADHQFAVMAHDAMQFRLMQKKGVAKEPIKPVKVQGSKSSTRVGNSQEQQRAAAFDRIKSTRSGDALQEYFKSIL